MADALAGHEGTVSIGAEKSQHGMEIGAENTLMTNNTSGINTEIKVNGQNLQTVKSIECLSSVITEEGSKTEILSRVAQNSSIDKTEPSLERPKYISQFQDTTNALPCHIHLLVCW